MPVRRGRTRSFMLLACLGIAVPLVAITSNSASGTPGVRPRAELEMDISGNGSSMNIGEPEIAVNPTNPNQLVVDGATFPAKIVFNGPSPVPDTCQGWSSANGGRSWQPAPLPPRSM